MLKHEIVTTIKTIKSKAHGVGQFHPFLALHFEINRREWNPALLPISASVRNLFH
jgi:hypothetical protein